MGLSDEDKKKMKDMMQAFIKSKTTGKGEKKVVPTFRIGFLEDNPDIGKVEHLPTGLIGLDVLTRGGWIKGQINQLIGAESVGKTTMMFRSIGAIQEHLDSAMISYLPAEKSYDIEWAEANGVNVNEVMTFEGGNAEENLDFCLRNLDINVDLLILDTLQALASKGELVDSKNKDKSTEDNTMALIPRVFSQFLRMYAAKTEGRTTLILVSQVRMNLGGNQAYLQETGGNAIKHYSNLTLSITRADSKSTGSDWPEAGDSLPPNSYIAKVKIKKCKINGRYKGNEIRLYFRRGHFDHKFNVLALAKDLGILQAKGASASFEWPEPQEDGTTKKVEIKSKGFSAMYDKITDEQLKWIEETLYKAYDEMVMEGFDNREETEEIVEAENEFQDGGGESSE